MNAGPRFNVVACHPALRLTALTCALVLWLSARGIAMDTEVKYRISGLFQPDRVDDLRRQAGVLPPPADAKPAGEITLVDVRYDTAVVTFRYDSESPPFKNRMPDQVQEQINSLLRTASRGGFGIAPLNPLALEQLKVERIPIAGHDCKGCNFAVYREVASLDGVDHAIVSYKEGHVTAWIDPAKLNRDAIVVALRKKGVDVIEPDASQTPATNQ
jgi:copper chaperone CopZ